MSSLYIGIMSGTSADGIDAVLISTTPKFSLVGCHSRSLSPDLRKRIHQLCLPGSNEIDRLGSLDIELAHEFSLCINELLRLTNTSPQKVVAIGSHGQTIRHRPPVNAGRSSLGEHPFTLQIVDPNTIAELTGITVVADFRRRDMAVGGQGAPLVPAFHQAIFGCNRTTRAIINIGGMANITWLAPKQRPSGFDTGPGNVLMNAWINKHLNKPYDQNGDWSRTGKVSQTLLQELLKHPFLALPPPKSTGREDFHLPWLNDCLSRHPALTPADVQATLVAFTATTITQQIDKLHHSAKNSISIILCGGGAYNTALVEAIALNRPDDEVLTTKNLGIAPEWIEAAAFAWLAQQTIERKPGNLCEVTGATREVILGGVYYA